MYVLPQLFKFMDSSLDMKYNSLNKNKRIYLVWPASKRESRSS